MRELNPAPRRRDWAVILAVVLLAYGLRAYAVGASALRGDEGFSVSVAAKPMAEMLMLMRQVEPNPPLYWTLVKVWMWVAGSSELALRWPSVLAGLVTATLTYRLGRSLMGLRAAQVAALLVAFSPLLVWYAQDARVYSLLTALTLGAAWQTWVAARRNTWRHWLAAGGLWWLALFAHYFAVLPFAAVGLALWLAPETHRRWRSALAMALGVGVTQLPWALYVAPLLIGHTKNWIVPTGVGEAVWRSLMAFSVGTQAMGATASLQWLGGGLLALLVAIGAVVTFRRRPTAAIWLIALGLGAPLLLGAISLFRPVFTEQYAMPALPGVLMLAAAGLLALPIWGRRFAHMRWVRPGALTLLAALAALALLSLSNYFFNPRYAKSPDWRTVVNYLVTTARPAEVVAINLPDPAFFIYYHGPMPVETVPPAPMAQISIADAEAQLGRLRDTYQHIRFFFSPNPAYDPDGFAGQWLETCCEKMTDSFVAGFRVQTFDTPSGSLAMRQPYAMDFAKGITLTGYRVANPEVAAGETVHLTLFWTARAPVADAYTVFVHLIAADGYDLLDADSPPVNGRRPTDGWAVGETIIDPHLLAIPTDMSPGDYELEIGLYLPATGERLLGMDSAGQALDQLRLPVAIRVRAP